MDQNNALLYGLKRVAKIHGIPLIYNITFIGCVDAGQYLHQGRFSCAILSNQRMDLTAANGKINLIEGLYPGK